MIVCCRKDILRVLINLIEARIGCDRLGLILMLLNYRCYPCTSALVLINFSLLIYLERILLRFLLICQSYVSLEATRIAIRILRFISSRF